MHCFVSEVGGQKLSSLLATGREVNVNPPTTWVMLSSQWAFPTSEVWGDDGPCFVKFLCCQRLVLGTCRDYHCRTGALYASAGLTEAQLHPQLCQHCLGLVSHRWTGCEVSFASGAGDPGPSWKQTRACLLPLRRDKQLPICFC